MDHHWSFKLPDANAALPAGSFRYFERAIECLAPRATLHRDYGEGSQPCCCSGCAGDLIQTLAVEYNTNRLLNNNAPRIKHILAQAELVRSSAEQLMKALLGLDDFSRQAFQKFGDSNAVCDLPLYAGYFKGDEDPDPGPDHESEWISNLVGLQRAATNVSREVKRSRGIEQNETADKGGKTNLFIEKNGSPDRNLVIAGWYIYEQFKPRQAKGSEDGPFHDFLKWIIRYAVGESPSTSLGVWIKELASPLRVKCEILNTHSAASKELKALSASSSVEDFSRRRHQLHSQIDVAMKELEKADLAIDRIRLGKKAGQK
jgi:hypothetical protein